MRKRRCILRPDLAGLRHAVAATAAQAGAASLTKGGVKNILAFAAVCAAVFVSFGKANAELPITRPPFLYLIDYRDTWFTDPAFANRLKECPPDVVHVGKAVPITHIWGPVPSMAGENQQTGVPGQGLDRNAIRLLSPDEIDKRIQTIKAGVTRLHELGVKEVYPYICSTTIAGSPDRREGFWNFYDHWDAYAKYVGPKPPEDPITWTVRDAKGNFATYYGKLSPNYFAPLNRYVVCKANTNWLEYESRLVQLVAQCGYDGIFTDNTGPGTDYCKYCQAMFKGWSQKNHTPEQLKQLTKMEDMADIAKVMRSMPLREMEKFRIFVCQNYLTTLRQAGRKVNPEFKIFPNSGQYENCIPVSEACDMYMFESPFSPGMQGDNPALADGLISVGPTGAGAAQQLTQKCAYSDPIKSVDTSMALSCPRSCPTGEPQTFLLKVTTVGSSGSSDGDGDAAEDFHLLLTDESGRSLRLDFQPRIAIGGTDLKGAVRPPQELKATWTPTREGSYRVTLGYRYTDLDHKDTTDRLEVTQPFWPDKPYHTHIAGLQYLMFAEARLIFYDYEAVAKGRDMIQELWMAELAAFSRGGTIAVTPGPRSKYGRFFRANAGLWENLRPFGQTGLLFAYWGTNQGEPRQGPNDRTVADYLSQRHILAVPLLDRKLQAGDLAGLRVIYAVAKEYEMTPPQVAALQNFVASGGTLVLGEPNAKINGKPVAEALALGVADKVARTDIVEWNWTNPVVPVAPISPSQDLLAGVRFAAYVAGGDKPSRLILHAVNFNVKLDKQPHLSKKFDTVSVDLPLPVGTQVAAARAYDPDADMANLKFQNKPGRVLLDIPDLHIYKVVEIMLEPAGGQK